MMRRPSSCSLTRLLCLELPAMRFYATIDSTMDTPALHTVMPADVPLMLPASSWSRRRMATPRLPAHVTERAADCGGFVATFRWGDYRYTPEQYVGWLRTWQPQWAATM